MRRFYYPNSALAGEKITLDEGNSRHIATVLRMDQGDEVEIITSSGAFLGGLVFVDNHGVEVLLGEAVLRSYESPRKIFLLQGLARGERMELVVQKATELGVYSIVAVPCARSVVRLAGEKSAKRSDRLQKIAEEAAKQCGRTHVPEVSVAKNFNEALKGLPSNTVILMPWEGEDTCSMKSALREINSENIAILIGPEGGFELGEVQEAITMGAVTLSLGTRILRTETAAISAVSIVQYELGDLGGDIHVD